MFGYCSHGVAYSLSRTFRVIDDNRSRTIDREELENGLRDFGVSMSRAEVQQLFDELDTDRSGHISFDEFLQALRVGLHLDIYLFFYL